jgi:hypothetical protein
MQDLSGVQVVVTAQGPDGMGHFVEAPQPYRLTVPGVADNIFVWTSIGTPDLPDNRGGPPSDIDVPPPGGTKFGIVCFAPHSAGEMSHTTSEVPFEIAEGGIHRHNSVDYEVVISGKVDLVLDSGEVRTLTPGTMLVMGGVKHAWRNVYDEPCVFATVVVGATNSATP